MQAHPSLTSFVVGTRAGSRRYYLVAVGTLVFSISVFAGPFLPEGWWSSHAWLAVALGIAIAAGAGLGNFGLVSGLAGAAVHVGVFGRSTFLLATGVPADLAAVPRLLLAWALASAAVGLLGYPVGVALRTGLGGRL